jgi:hypothetical protein
MLKKSAVDGLGIRGEGPQRDSQKYDYVGSDKKVRTCALTRGVGPR